MKTYIGTDEHGQRAYMTWELKDGKFPSSGELWVDIPPSLNGGDSHFKDSYLCRYSTEDLQNLHGLELRVPQL